MIEEIDASNSDMGLPVCFPEKKEQNQHTETAQEAYGPRIRFELEPWNPGYSPSVSLYDDGSMKICHSGRCVRMPVKKWMQLSNTEVDIK